MLKNTFAAGCVPAGDTIRNATDSIRCDAEVAWALAVRLKSTLGGGLTLTSVTRELLPNNKSGDRELTRALTLPEFAA